MKNSYKTLRRGIVAGLMATGLINAQEIVAVDKPTTEPIAKSERRLIFKPPFRGTPTARARVGGGVRSMNASARPFVVVLSPEFTGLTTRSQPTLYWYQSDPVDMSYELTVNKGYDTVLHKTLQDAGNAGIRRLDLDSSDIKLKPGVEYEWNIALIPNPDDRARDLVSTGTITRMQPDESLTQTLTGASPTDLPFIYAEHGIWYDALDAISKEIATNPNDRSLTDLRDDLLRQVGLDMATKEPGAE